MRKTLIVCLLCIAASLLLMLYALRDPVRENGTPAAVYAYLIADDIGATAMQHRQGIQQAAAERAVEIMTYTADKNAVQTPQLLSFLSQLGETDTKGIILSACEPEVVRAAAQTAQEMSIPLAYLFESDQAGAFSLSVDEALGQALAGAVTDAAGNAPIAVLAGDDPESLRRLSGLQNALSAPFTLYTDVADVPPVAARLLVLTPEWLSALPTQDGQDIWAIDPGDERVSWLETGRIRGLAVRMPYAEGYLAFSALLQNANPGAIPCPVRVITRDTMYDSENVKLMFPLLQ